MLASSIDNVLCKLQLNEFIIVIITRFQRRAYKTDEL
jgi:hypothetical protein